MKIFLQWHLNEQAYLHMVTADQIENGPLTVGRAPQCDIVLNAPTVSRQHAKLLWVDETIQVQNINQSNNLLRINHRKLNPQETMPLQSGDRLQLGQVAVRVSLSTEEEPTQPRNPAITTIKTEELELLTPAPTSIDSTPNPPAPAVITRYQVGQTIGKYTLTEHLGRGAMAEVFKARQPHIDRDVAVKIMHPHLANQDGFVSRFKREAHSLAHLQHPHILRVFDFDHQNNLYYMVMDYMAGQNLHQYLADKETLPVTEALTITKQLCEALHYAHQRQIVHRDIKPENVMFTDDSHKKVMLADFGLARLTNQRLTLTGTRIGTPGYMSPEVAQGHKATELADIYSLGVMLYEMLTGKTPYRGHTPLMVLEEQLHTPLTPPSRHVAGIPAEVDALVEQALSANPKNRIQTAAQFHKALQKIIRSLSKEKRQRTSSQIKPKGIPTWRKMAGRWWPLAAAVTGAISIAGMTLGALLMA